MAATLRLCLMTHVEDNESWDSDKAESLGNFAEEVGKTVALGPRGAKVSVQFGRNFLESEDPGTYPLGGPATALQTVLYRGGNFWTHTHTTDYDNLRSNYSCVRSAYQHDKNTGNTTGGAGGRSGGWGFNGADWVSITQAAGIRLMNSSAMGAHALVPSSARPYTYTDEEIEKLHPKGQAPGPIHMDVMTMRQRPFWMNVASNWFARTDSTYPSTLYIGSVMMIPGPGKLDIPGLSEGRTAFGVTSFSDADLKCALTQVAAAHHNMVTHQDSITNVWYGHMPLRNLTPANIALVGFFVDSVNYLMDVNGGTPLARWENMNEIASWFADPLSCYW